MQGRNTRKKRCFKIEPSPRLRQIIAVKKPLITKNTGIRKPWITKKKVPKASCCSLSWTPQGNGTKESAPCSAIPRIIAVARSASMSW